MSDLNKEKQMRLKNNLYASQKAYKRLENAIKYNDRNETYAAIGELLLWVMNIHDWHINNGNKSYTKRAENDENGKLLFGLRHAFNSMKHNMKFYTFHDKKQAFSYKNFSYANFDYRPVIFNWREEANILDEGPDNQINNYIKYIVGKEVLATLGNALIFLNKESQKLINNIKESLGAILLKGLSSLSVEFISWKGREGKKSEIL